MVDFARPGRERLRNDQNPPQTILHAYANMARRFVDEAEREDVLAYLGLHPGVVQKAAQSLVDTLHAAGAMTDLRRAAMYRRIKERLTVPPDPSYDQRSRDEVDCLRDALSDMAGDPEFWSDDRPVYVCRPESGDGRSPVLTAGDLRKILHELEASRSERDSMEGQIRRLRDKEVYSRIPLHLARESDEEG